jgi:hypothetical protein
MIASWVLATLSALAAPQVGEATLEVAPVEARIGQPVEWILRVRHAVNDAPVVLADPVTDGTWMLTEGPLRDTSIVDAGLESESGLTTMRWSVMSLTGGERTLPELEVRLESGGTLIARPETLVVRGDLEEGEDAPRPLADFHVIEERTSGLHWTRFGLIGLVGTIIVGGLVLLARPRRPAPVPPPPSPRQRLRTLADSAHGAGVEEEGSARRIAFELHGILRGAVDERFEQSMSGHTDEEWCEVVRSTLGADGRLPEETLRSIGALLAWCGEVRFGGAHPTRFRVEEQLETAAGILDRIGPIGASTGAAGEADA